MDHILHWQASASSNTYSLVEFSYGYKNGGKKRKKEKEEKQFHQQAARKLKAVIFASVGVNERV